MAEYDLGLFLRLNAEYAAKPVVPAPRSFDRASLTDQAIRRAASISARLDIGHKRVLEVGCARGHLGRTLAESYGCEYVGVDIVDYREWKEQRSDSVKFVKQDVTNSDISDLGRFDAIVSFAVLEHVVHPYTMLRTMYDLLSPGGIAYIAANLYRGPQASHRYREVFFPWPHLLFDDVVWREFYRKEHNIDNSFSWVNKLTYAQYLLYFYQIGFRQRRVWLTPDRFDAEFYARFEEKLSPYPIFDLSHDFIYAILERPIADTRREKIAAEIEADRLQRRLDSIHNSLSWRITRPLRFTSRLIRRH
jgi:SAM-dependent methyltransferase